MSGGARMLDGYIAREQDRAALQWRTSCASDDALKRHIEVQLLEGRLPSVQGVSKSHRGTGGPRIVSRHTIGPTDVERRPRSDADVLDERWDDVAVPGLLDKSAARVRQSQGIVRV